LDHSSGNRVATVSRPSGGKAAFFPIKLKAYVKDQKVSGNLKNVHISRLLTALIRVKSVFFFLTELTASIPSESETVKI
jgi:hypothetical protein